jgi:hypothetical protein
MSRCETAKAWTAAARSAEPGTNLQETCPHATCGGCVRVLVTDRGTVIASTVETHCDNVERLREEPGSSTVSPYSINF